MIKIVYLLLVSWNPAVSSAGVLSRATKEAKSEGRSAVQQMA